MHIVLLEDPLTGENRPVTLPRPAFAVSLAGTRLWDVARHHGSAVSALVRPYLQAVTERAFDLAPLPRGAALYLNASLAPSFDLVGELIAEAERGESFLVRHDSRVAAAYIAGPLDLAGQDVSTLASLLVDQPHRALRRELSLLAYPFDLIRQHQEGFEANLPFLMDGRSEVRPGVFARGEVSIHPTAVLDASEGPILLDQGVSVGPFALLVGPLIIGRGTKVIERATIKEQVQIGHTCKIGGEVECSIVEPYTNKQHHGFLGHSYVGSWVNLGAGTCNSDLKNTYGEVTIEHRGYRVKTTMQFLGCVIGDFSKTAINTSIFTGKTIGVASFVYGFAGTNVPSFTNYARTFGQQTESPLDVVVTVQRRMFARRGVEQTPADVKLLEALHELTRDERLMSDEPVTF